MSAKYLIVGLGNFGIEYAHTRHNIGFDVLNTLAEKQSISFTTGRLADIAEYKFKGRKIILVKPNTYMNLSGKALHYWMQQEKVAIENVLVISDDLALPLATLRIKPKGGAGGHNGLSHIIETLGHDNFVRLRFGIGDNFSKGKQVDYVLGKWTTEEKEFVTQGILRATEMIASFVIQGAQSTMNQFNNK